MMTVPPFSSLIIIFAYSHLDFAANYSYSYVLFSKLVLRNSF